MAEKEGNTRNFTYILQNIMRISNWNFSNFYVFYLSHGYKKGKVILLQAWCGPEGG